MQFVPVGTGFAPDFSRLAPVGSLLGAVGTPLRVVQFNLAPDNFNLALVKFGLRRHDAAFVNATRRVELKRGRVRALQIKAAPLQLIPARNFVETASGLNRFYQSYYISWQNGAEALTGYWVLR
jgi:hypothetical protein